MMKFNILTIFPEAFDSYLDTSIIGRARKEGLIKVNIIDIRDFTHDKHRTVDDTPYGGGAGMVMKVEPIYEALGSLDKRGKTLLLSAGGKKFDEDMARELSAEKEITLVCGRYEGVDQRVADHMCDREISVGPYVLSGGELPAMTIVDAVSRLVPGVLGNEESLKEESFDLEDGAKEYPQYTKPEEFKSWKVPEILLSGDHGKVNEWRKKKSSTS